MFTRLMVIFKNFSFIFIYSFLAVLGLRWYAQASSSCSEHGSYSLVLVNGLLIVVASLGAEQRI